VEGFNGKQWDEPLDREMFDSLLEAQVLIERWRMAYNTVRPYNSLEYRPPAPEARQPRAVAAARPPRADRGFL
jgi:putative transposase